MLTTHQVNNRTIISTVFINNYTRFWTSAKPHGFFACLFNSKGTHTGKLIILFDHTQFSQIVRWTNFRRSSLEPLSWVSVTSADSSETLLSCDLCWIWSLLNFFEKNEQGLTCLLTSSRLFHVNTSLSAASSNFS